MIKVSDYIAKYIKKIGIKHVFLVTGAGSMHLNDAFGQRNMYVCNHHEQTSAIAAEAYARVNEFLGVCNVTTGPGATNAITGVMGAWVDSIPLLCISGQVKQSMSLYKHSGYRQIGTQEIPIVDIVKPITKYATAILNPYNVAYELEKAIFIATNDRPGPVWLDIPLDVQGALIDENKLCHFIPPKGRSYKTVILEEIKKATEMITLAKRPLIVAGYGIRLGKSLKEFYAFINKSKIPVITSVQAHDLMWENHPLFAGRFGVFGTRAGNFALQNADLLLILGSRLHVIDTGYDFDHFARESKKILVEIDKKELKKPYIPIDLPIHTDVKMFLSGMIKHNTIYPSFSSWTKKCKAWRKTYPVCLPEYKQTKKSINSYYFINTLSKLLKSDDTIITGNGSAYTCSLQGLKLKKGQRFIYNVGCAAMGYDLPAAIGAFFAHPQKRIILLTGDGSIQMNIQELQTIVHHRIPVKIFVFNNQGYLSIRITQETFLKRFYGNNKETGVSFPDIRKISKAYGIPSTKLVTQNNLDRKIEKILKSHGPFICEIMMSSNQRLIPKPSSVLKPDGTLVSKPLEDMYPFLKREEFIKNMIIEPVNTELT